MRTAVSLVALSAATTAGACTTCRPSVNAAVYNAEFPARLGLLLAVPLAIGLAAVAAHFIERPGARKG